MRHEDPLHAFAQKMLAQAGPALSPIEARRAQRDEARRECVKSFWLTASVAVFMICLGVGFVVWAMVNPSGPAGSEAKALLGGLLMCALFVTVGMLFGVVARQFRVPWDLARRGHDGRAVVISLEPGTTMRRGKRGPVVLTLGHAQLAVRVGGGAPYAVAATVVAEVHGWPVPGQEVAVRVDPSDPQRVLLSDAMG